MSPTPKSETSSRSSIIFSRHHRAIYAYLLGRCGDVDAASDLLQETFLRAWRHLGEVRKVPEDRRRYWLMAVARNLAHDYHRRQGVRAPFSEALPDPLPAAGPDQDVAALAELGEQAARVDGAIARLPEDLRVIVTMRYLGEMSSAEIAAARDRPAGTVRYQLAKARALLAQELGLPGPEGSQHATGERRSK